MRYGTMNLLGTLALSTYTLVIYAIKLNQTQKNRRTLKRCGDSGINLRDLLHESLSDTLVHRIFTCHAICINNTRINSWAISGKLLQRYVNRASGAGIDT